MERAEQLRLDITGIEPWKNGAFYQVLTFEQFGASPCDPNWYKTAFQRFVDRKEDLQYAASYFVPKELLT